MGEWGSVLFPILEKNDPSQIRRAIQLELPKFMLKRGMGGCVETPAGIYGLLLNNRYGRALSGPPANRSFEPSVSRSNEMVSPFVLRQCASYRISISLYHFHIQPELLSSFCEQERLPIVSRHADTLRLWSYFMRSDNGRVADRVSLPYASKLKRCYAAHNSRIVMMQGCLTKCDCAFADCQIVKPLN